MTRPDADLSKQLVMLSGVVVGRNGKGGSGTVILLEDGSVALLTAKHVVIECIRNTGGIAIGVPNSGVKFQVPKLIRMDSSQHGDAAYLIFNSLPGTIPAVPFWKWTKNHTGAVPGLWTFACGFPGALKTISGNRVSSTCVYIGDKILSVQPTSVVSGINEAVHGIPRSLQGMSGGGLFSESGDFIGVIVGEERNTASKRGALHTLLPNGFPELYRPFSMPLDAPSGGFYGMKRTVSFDMIDPATSKSIATVGVIAEVLKSKTNPTHRFGRFGRLLTLEFIIPGSAVHFPINIESIFFWTDDTDKGIERAIREEFKFLLLRIGWLLRDGRGGDDMGLIQVSPMV